MAFYFVYLHGVIHLAFFYFCSITFFCCINVNVNLLGKKLWLYKATFCELHMAFSGKTKPTLQSYIGTEYFYIKLFFTYLGQYVKTFQT